MSRHTFYLFDHFIGSDQHRLRNGQSKSLRGLYIDDQIKTDGLFDGKSTCRFALKEFVDIDSGASINNAQFWSISNEASGFCEVPIDRDYRESVLCREVENFPPCWVIAPSSMTKSASALARDALSKASAKSFGSCTGRRTNFSLVARLCARPHPLSRLLPYCCPDRAQPCAWSWGVFREAARPPLAQVRLA